MFSVSRNSALFKTYNALSKTVLFSTVTPIKCNGDTDAFRDLCTFFRTTLFYLIISIPSWILFLYAFFNVIYELVLSVLNFKLEVTTTIIVALGGLVLAICILGSILYLLFALAEKTTDKVGDSDFLHLMSEAIKNKHRKICKIIKVVDKND